MNNFFVYLFNRSASLEKAMEEHPYLAPFVSYPFERRVYCTSDGREILDATVAAFVVARHRIYQQSPLCELPEDLNSYVARDILAYSRAMIQIDFPNSDYSELESRVHKNATPYSEHELLRACIAVLQKAPPLYTGTFYRYPAQDKVTP